LLFTLSFKELDLKKDYLSVQHNYYSITLGLCWLKLNEAQIEDITGKVFRTIISNGRDGILQSELWKELDLTSRDGSRVAIRLEKRSLIRREKMLQHGRWTYRLFAVKLPVDTTSIEQAPCLTCPFEHMCSIDGSYSPTSCNLIEEWLIKSFDNASLKAPKLYKK
jgi:hypothetical protein